MDIADGQSSGRPFTCVDVEKLAERSAFLHYWLNDANVQFLKLVLVNR